MCMANCRLAARLSAQMPFERVWLAFGLLSNDIFRSRVRLEELLSLLFFITSLVFPENPTILLARKCFFCSPNPVVYPFILLVNGLYIMVHLYSVVYRMRLHVCLFVCFSKSVVS